MIAPETPADPVILATPQAYEVTGLGFQPGTFAETNAEIMLAGLNDEADRLGFVDQTYFLETGRSMIFPNDSDAGADVLGFNFNGLTFEGKFDTYARVQVGRLVGAPPLRALCAVFREATLLPFFDVVPETSRLYVPVLAVDVILSTE